MKVYLAALLYNDFRPGSATYNRLDDCEKRAVEEVTDALDSYHYINNERMTKRIRSTGRKIFLDSGAFSSFTQGVKVDINRYCRFIHKHGDLFEQVSVLDAIGDPKQTYFNQMEMERQGIVPIPCYHYGESPDVLAHYIDHYPYISIGGMVPISTPQLKVWLDRLWDMHLVNPDGTPKAKIHGFGMTSVPLMSRYPWYSVDSSSWVQLGGMGNIFLPGFGTLAVSEHAPQRKQKGRHIDSITEINREHILAYIDNLGFDLDRLRRVHLSRKTFNIVTYGSLAAIDRDTFVLPQPGLF